MKTLFTAIALLCYASLFSQAGGLDSSFATGGKFIYNDNTYPVYVYASNDAAIQKDGKTILAGYGYNYNTGYYAQQMVVMRLNKNGTLDNTFGDGGKTFVSFYGPHGEQGNNQAFNVSIQSDGKIVVAGTSFTGFYIDSLNTYNYDDIIVARLNTNGTLDNTFNGNGTKTIDLSSYTRAALYTSYSFDYCFSAAIKSNGKIVLGGYTEINDYSNGNYEAPFAIQLNTDGSFDNSFAGSGIHLIPTTPGSSSIAYRIATAGNDKIVLSGYTYPNNSSSGRDVLVIRLKSNGYEDSTFGGNGRVTVDISGSNASSGALAVLPNNKILLGADIYSTIPDSSRIALLKLNTNGTLDNTFNGTGKSIVATGSNAYETDIALQKDGKILLSGSQNANYADSSSLSPAYAGSDNNLLFRFTADGKADSTFGTYGKTVIDFGNYTDNIRDFSTAVNLQSDGKAVISGADYTINSPCAARILTAGKNYGITAPPNQLAVAAAGQCSVVFNNIDPVIYPDTSFSIIKYSLCRAGSTTAYDSGYGSLSGKPFPIGSTTVVYTSIIDGLQRGLFQVNVTGGMPAGALDFDGVNDRVYINSYLDPVNSISYGQYAFEAWIKVRAYSADGSLIFGNERNSNSGIIVQLNSKGYITTYQPSLGYVVSKSKVALNKWTHIAFTQTNSSLDLYVNGKFVQTLLSAPYLHTSTYTNFYLGAYTDDDINFSRYFNGEMDEVKIWGQAICKTQILNNLRCETVDGSSQGLLAHFTFNQGNAACDNQTVTTAYGYFVTGTLQNFALTGPTSNWVAGYVSGSCAPFVPLSITSYPSSVNVQATGDSCGATVNFAVTYSSGCSANPTITYSQNPGTYFPTGTTYVSVTLQDSFGNTQYVYFPVTVTETVPPALVLKDTTVILNESGYAYVNPYDLIDSLYDNCTPSYYLYPVVSGNTYLNCNNKGPNPITITVYDQSGNSTTKTAYVTIAPYVATATVTAIPNPQQYSDYTTVIATLPAAQNLYYNGCLYGSQVTFKVGGKDAGTIVLSPDGYGNLTGAISYRLTDIFPKKITAVFSGVDSTVYKLASNTVSTTLNGAPENATVDYIESQLINTSSNKVTIPVSVQLTDSADGSRGDIRKSIVTFLIQPITPGATVTGSNTVTVSSLEFISSDKTSGVARGNFTVNLGRNTTAKFNVIATVGNYYAGSTTAVVYVSKSGSSLIVNNNKTSLNDGIKSLENSDFGVTVLPNPSRNEFSLQVSSSHTMDKVNIRISDAVGRVIETFSNVGVGNIVKVGTNYQPGIYMAEISQGANRKSYKLIKL